MDGKATSGVAATSRPESVAGAAPSALFRPGRIGTVTLKNRIVMAAMTTRAADRDGFVTDALVAYYEARAEGGVGLVTLEMAAPEPVGRHRNNELGIHHDKFIPGLGRVTERLHARGAKVAIQLGHAGGHTQAAIAGERPIAPSSVPHVVQEGHTETVLPLEMTHERIERTIEAFVAAAARAREAGIDVVELHAAHGYLLSQFLTPAENTRTDEYGGALENRARISLEIIRRIKARLPGYPVIFRLNGDDFFPGGLSVADAEEMAVLSVAAGADAVHVTGGHYRSLPEASVMIPPMALPDATFLKYAVAIKARVSAPVIAVGRLGDPDRARAVVDRGEADFVALGRPLLADPRWAARAMAGEPVRRCIACNSCVDGMRAGGKLHCLVNPTAGRETAFAGVDAAASPHWRGKRIAVVGAGPAGLSFAALVSRDADVTVFEKNARAGGAFRLAGLAPRFQGVAADQGVMMRFIAGLEAENAGNGVRFRYGFDAERDLAALDGFDEIVLATGAAYRFGIGGLVAFALQSGLARAPGFRALASNERVREWFYYDARRPNGALADALRARGLSVRVIGDGCKAGKATEAIRSAFLLARSPAGDELGIEGDGST